MLKRRQVAESAYAACLVGIAAVSAPFCGTPATAQTPSAPKPPVVSVLLRANETTVKAGGPVLVERIVTNRSNHDVTVARDVYPPACAVDVLDASGNFAKDRKLGYRHGRPDLEQLATMSPDDILKSGLINGKLAWLKLKPGESFSQTWDVAEFYDLTGSGQYRMTAYVSDPESAVLIRSNTVHVTVSE
jgi:hypothetical protein